MIADEGDLSKYHPAYNVDNERIGAPKDEPYDLVPPRHKTTFAPDIDASALVEGTMTRLETTSVFPQRGRDDAAQ